jgi:hypothetical protein
MGFERPRFSVGPTARSVARARTRARLARFHANPRCVFAEPPELCVEPPEFRREPPEFRREPPEFRRERLAACLGTPKSFVEPSHARLATLFERRTVARRARCADARVTQEPLSRLREPLHVGKDASPLIYSSPPSRRAAHASCRAALRVRRASRVVHRASRRVPRASLAPRSRRSLHEPSGRPNPRRGAPRSLGLPTRSESRATRSSGRATRSLCLPRRSSGGSRSSPRVAAAPRLPCEKTGRRAARSARVSPSSERRLLHTRDGAYCHPAMARRDALPRTSPTTVSTTLDSPSSSRAGDHTVDRTAQNPFRRCCT